MIPKQLNLPFPGPTMDNEPNPDGIEYKIKRIETDYAKTFDGRVKVNESEFTYLKDGRIITKFSTEFLD